MNKILIKDVDKLTETEEIPSIPKPKFKINYEEFDEDGVEYAPEQFPENEIYYTL
jgi:hypothetical protein